MNKPAKHEKSSVFFISPHSDVKEDVLRYYDINRSKDAKGSPGRTANGTYKNQLKAIAEDFFEGLDSRGKMIKIRRVHAL